MRLLSRCGHLNSKKGGPEENTSLTSHVGKIRHPLDGDGMYLPVTGLIPQPSRGPGSARSHCCAVSVGQDSARRVNAERRSNCIRTDSKLPLDFI